MADSKITALTAISTVDPTADPLVIVDVSDTSMAASGTTKKSTINQLLGAGGTATLASATITGVLTANGGISMANATAIASSGAVALYVDTNQLVLRARATNGILFQESTGVNNLLTISNAGVFGFLDGAGGTRMTLNATGLGVGVTAAQKLTVLTNAGISATTATAADDRLIFTENMPAANLGSQIVWKSAGNGNAYASIGFTNGAAGNTGSLIFSTSSSIFGSNNVERMRIDSAGNPIFQPSATPATLGTNGMLTVNATSNTNLRFSYRGSDGVTRTADLTLA